MVFTFLWPLTLGPRTFSRLLSSSPRTPSTDSSSGWRTFTPALRFHVDSLFHRISPPLPASLLPNPYVLGIEVLWALFPFRDFFLHLWCSLIFLSQSEVRAYLKISPENLQVPIGQNGGKALLQQVNKLKLVQ